ncbi:hypothetical protein [uncultured Amnibacterium sp.]|uniref:hypothetical protein n=1 Tax=uncultured Amnibacterium sp. TaxID=1631851 RepID=UPI0035CCA57B
MTVVALVQLGPPLLLLAVLGFGFAPRLVLRVIVIAWPSWHPRRRELLAELAAVPRRDRPFWVAEQLEVALLEGVGGRLMGRFGSLLEADMHLRVTWVRGDTFIGRPAAPGDVLDLDVHVDGFVVRARVRVVRHTLGARGVLVAQLLDAEALGERFARRQLLRFVCGAVVPIDLAERSGSTSRKHGSSKLVFRDSTPVARRRRLARRGIGFPLRPQALGQHSASGLRAADDQRRHAG